VGFARFVSVLVPQLSPRTMVGFTVSLPSGPIEVGLSPQRVLAIASIFLLTWINVRGVRVAAFVQTLLTSIKVLSLIALILLGLTIGRSGVVIAANFGATFWPPDGVGLGALPLLGAAMVGALFAMDAWNNVGFAADELRTPSRDLPFAMLTGVVIVTVLYVSANVAYLNVLGIDAIANAPQDRVATAVLEAIFGAPGMYVMAAAIVVSTIGCNNGLILSGARVYYAMARDGLFFGKAAELHPTHKTPAFGLFVQAGWASVLCASGTYGQLLDYVVFAALMFYLLTAIGLFALRRRRPDAERPVVVPAYPWLPAAYALLTAALCLDLLIEKPQYSWLGLGIVALGLPVYAMWRWWGAAPVVDEKV
jgi:APA family basic amino acid/polyamine antiporter